MTLQDLLDLRYGAYGDDELQRMLAEGADPNQRGDGPEAPIHVAARRRRVKAIEILLDHGADINARNAHGKTAYAHAIRRGFGDVVAALRARDTVTSLDTSRRTSLNTPLDTSLNPADEFAVAIVEGNLDAARRILAEDALIIRTGNPEEDRLLADMAGKLKPEPVMLLIRAGADIAAPGLDGGTPLHQAAWFGSPMNARMLLAAGAPLELLDSTHRSTPLGWATHGSRFSGGADRRPEIYVEIVEMLLDAGAMANEQMLKDASEQVRETLVRRLGGYFSREHPI
jgi:ankyrin repeat protein